MSRAHRPESLSVPAIHCAVHGEQPGRTRCKWCGFDPFKSVNRLVFSSLRQGALARSASPESGLSFPLDVAHDQFQRDADVLEA